MSPTERHYPWHVGLVAAGVVTAILALAVGPAWQVGVGVGCLALAALWFAVDVARERRGAGSGDPSVRVAVVPSTGSIRAALKGNR